MYLNRERIMLKPKIHYFVIYGDVVDVIISFKMLLCITISELEEIDSRSLSRHDIQILVGFGCPTADKKVVFSAKLLRKHVHLDEGDVR